MDKFHHLWVSFIDNTLVATFNAILSFLKSKKGMYIAIVIIAYIILY